METVRIAILDAYDNVLTFMDNDAPKALHYYDDELHEYLKGTANTFSFKASAKHEDSQSLVEGNKIAFVYRDRDYYLNIMNVRRDELEVEAMAYSLSFELLNEEKEKYAASKAMSFAEYLAALDYEKVLTLGINEVSDKSIKHEWTGTDTLLARIFSLATVFSAEVEFVPELNDDYSLKRIVLNVYKEHTDTVQGVGTDRADIVLRYGINVTGVTKTSDITELCTAIRPFGKDGLTIKSLDKTEYDADGNVEYKSPKDNRNILAVQARDRFPSNLLSNANDRYIAKVWEYDTDNVNVLYGQALAELKKLCVPQVTYEVEGYFDVAIGDTVTIADEEFTPELYLQARVTEQSVSFTNQSRNKTKFSNFKELQSEIDSSLIQKMNDLIAENKVYSCAISTDNGIVFKNGIGTTTLTANVRDSGTDVVDDFTITWSKDGVELATGKTIAINASDINQKSVYRFEAKDASGKARGSYEVTVSNVTDGADGYSPSLSVEKEGGVTMITATDKSGTTKAEVKDGAPTGITESETEPEEKYNGMLWKHIGTVEGLITNAIYRWNGSEWKLYIFTAENIDVQNLFAQTIEATGAITAGNFRFRDKVFGVRNINDDDILFTLISFVNAISGGNILEINPDHSFADVIMHYNDGTGAKQSFSLRTDLGKYALKGDIADGRYVTSEIDTGETWVNGKTIYRKVINVGAISSAKITKAHGISGATAIWIDFSHSFLTATVNGVVNYYPINRFQVLPQSSATGWSNSSHVRPYVNNTNIVLEVGTNANFSGCYVTLLYTK